jgi:DNA polymerase V
LPPLFGFTNSVSFGRPIEREQELAEAIAHYAALAAMKLRHQESVAALISLFISTNRFDTESVLYANGTSQRLPFATDFTPDFIAVAQTLLQQIYRSGIRYHRAGVYLAEVGPRHVIQPDLFGDFDFEQEARKARLMAVIDIITAFCGRDTVFFGAQGVARSWQSRAARRSDAYTTRWSDILIVSAR